MVRRRAPGVKRSGRRCLCGGRLLGAAKNSAAQLRRAGGCAFFWARTAAQSAGRGVLRLRAGVAALAAGKLAVYVVLYGLTPRRVIAGWFLGVLAVWCVLALVRVFRAIPAAHIAILVLAVSFTMLACVDMKQRIINANLARVEAGIDEEPDWGVLWECGYQEET